MLYTTITNVAYYETLREDARDGETRWTVNRHVRAGDQVILYVCAPVSAIVAVGEAEIDVELEEDPASPWMGRWFADLDGLRMLERPITRAELMRAFPAWGYWRQPRQSVAVPGEYVVELERLLTRR